MPIIDLALHAAPERNTPYRRIVVVGAGAWGTALAAVAARAGRETTLLTRSAAQAETIARTRRNPDYLDGIALPEGLAATADPAVLADADLALVVVPSHALRAAMTALAAVLKPGVPVALAAKGIERDTGLLMSEVAAQAAPGHPIAVLSGPSFADEVARDLPTAVVIASACAEGGDPAASVAARLALSLGTATFRPYISDDVTGVEVGGAVKNVIAIACGMAEGAGFGHNARAALITRGLDEIKRLADALGGRFETVSGLSGMGDLSLTASDPKSRNYAYGVTRGRGDAPSSRVLVEGVANALSVTDLARARGVAMPICEAVRSVVHDGEAFTEAFARLWTSPLEAEPRAMTLALDHPAAS